MLKGKGREGMGAGNISGCACSITSQSCGRLQDKACLSGERRFAEEAGAAEGDSRRVREPEVGGTGSGMKIGSATGVTSAGTTSGGTNGGAFDVGGWKGTGGGRRPLASNRALVLSTKELVSPVGLPLYAASRNQGEGSIGVVSAHGTLPANALR